MKVKTTLVLSFFTFALLITCSSQDEFYTVEIVDGVRTVHNFKPQWGDAPKVALEFVQKIGGLDETDENYQFYRPSELVRDKEGFIYLMDSGNNRIQKFDSLGQFVQTIGRKGQGPVEFERARSLNIDKDLNLVVNDLGNNRAQIISKDGKYIDAINLAGNPFYIRVLRSNNFVIQSISSLLQIFDRDEKNWKPKLLTLLDPDGAFIKRFVELKNFEESRNNLVNQRGNTISFEVDNEDNIYVEFWYQNRIDIYAPDGTLKTVISRNLDFELDYETSILIIPGPDPNTPREMPTAEFSDVSTKGLGIDNKGRLWVPTYRRQRNPDNEDDIFTANDLIVLEIYDREGLLLGRIPTDFYFKRFRVFDNRLYFIDHNHNVCVYEYKIVEK